MSTANVSMSVDDDQHAASPRVTVRGELDLTTGRSFAQWVLDVLRVVAGVVRKLVIDLRQVAFCGAAGVNALVEIAHAAKDASIELIVVASTAVRRVLQALALDDRFRLVDELDEAS